MEEVHKAVLKRKRVHDDEIVPVPDKIRDHNREEGMKASVGRERQI